MNPKHAIKQVDRLVGTMKFKPWDLFSRHVPKTVGDRKQIVVAMDWTDFDHDDQSTIALHLIEKHGKSQPLIWLSVWKYELKDQRGVGARVDLTAHYGRNNPLPGTYFMQCARKQADRVSPYG